MGTTHVLSGLFVFKMDPRAFIKSHLSSIVDVICVNEDVVHKDELLSKLLAFYDDPTSNAHNQLVFSVSKLTPTSAARFHNAKVGMQTLMERAIKASSDNEQMETELAELLIMLEVD